MVGSDASDGQPNVRSIIRRLRRGGHRRTARRRRLNLRASTVLGSLGPELRQQFTDALTALDLELDDSTAVVRARRGVCTLKVGSVAVKAFAQAQFDYWQREASAYKRSRSRIWRHLSLALASCGSRPPGSTSSRRSRRWFRAIRSIKR